MMAAGTDLQQQCQDLLSKLRTNQVSIHQGLISSCGASSLDNNLEKQLPQQKPEYARQKLKSIMKNGNGRSAVSDGHRVIPGSSKENSAFKRQPEKVQGPKPGESNGKEILKTDIPERSKLAQGTNKDSDPQADTDAMHDYFQSGVSNSLMEGGIDSFQEPVSTEDNAQLSVGPAKPTTPTSVRRRRIIDRNVHVDSKLDDEDLQELEKNARGLNFSYSQALADEDTLRKTHPAEVRENTNENNSCGVAGRDEDATLSYQKCLVDRGNNRQLNNFIRDTTIKPKSLLNSTQSMSTSYSKQGPGVSFQNASSASGASSLFRSQARDRRMLGYDWIAALVNNDAGLMDESESYFQELREFRRCNRDECSNDFYMEGPFTLTESEPPEVEKAIKETNVQPYTVNERLFTVPVTENLLGEPLNPGKDNTKEEPTQDSPRFVRVSIPRSTLQMPYKVRPHRRRSFDASDSCSLAEHCLMGWNAVSPATLPTASSLSLTDAMTGVNPKHATTMAEAEKVAATFHWPILTDPKPPGDPLPTWRKQYMDTTLNFLHSDSSNMSLSASLEDRGARGSGSVQRRTDQLLNSTYSMMYEMQKVREQREEERMRTSGKVAS